MSIFDTVDPRLIDYANPEHDGYPDELKMGDTPDVLREACGDASRDFPKSLWIEPKDWAAKVEENNKYRTWAINYCDRFSNQSPTHECTCHALRVLAESCRNRQRGVIYKDGPKVGYRYPESELGSVWLSPLSIYAEANPRRWGGAGCRQVLEIACRRGFLPDKTQPYKYGFKHDLPGTSGKGNTNMSSGAWTPLSSFPDGWKDTASWFRPQEVIFPESWEQVVCLVLHGYAVEVGRDGHAIPYTFWNQKEQLMGYVDSYDIVRYDSLRKVKYASNGAFAIASMTTPDSWMNPAG